MKKLFRIAALGLMVALAPFAAHASPVIQTTDFINDATRTHFNGFEAIPNDGTFYTGGSGPYIEDGIKVQQINGDPGNDIWITYSGGRFEGNYSWYPDGGGSGYTDITMADGSNFDSIGFYAGTGDGPSLILYDLLLNGVSVLSGSTAAPIPGQFQYIGFSGGGFDELRVRDNWIPGSNFYDGGTALTLDAIETTGAAAPVPEPGTLALLILGFVTLGVGLRKKLV